MPERVSAAGLIAEAGSLDILAAASGDGSGSRAGAMDLTQAVCSPGSALKPLLYGLAFHEGLARPDTVLSDLQRRFGRYAPKSYDHTFTAPVMAETSLRLLFPPADAELSMDGPVPLRVIGGRRPVGFLVDGQMLASRPISRVVDWLPTGPGYYTLSVVDADGLADRVRVRVR